MATPREVGMKHGPTNTRELTELKKTLSLSRVQTNFLVGTILGDGYLMSSRSGKAARLQIRHNYKYIDYVEWKFSYFRKWCLTKSRFDKCNNSFVFKTVSHKQLMDLGKMFYGDQGKFVPDKIDRLLIDPLSLAIWFMDDGSGDKRTCRLKLSTYAFKKKGNLLLKKCLEQNFGLKTMIIWDCKGCYLYFPKDDAIRLCQLINPYILTCMEYKLTKVKTYLTP